MVEQLADEVEAVIAARSRKGDRTGSPLRRFHPEDALLLPSLAGSDRHENGQWVLDQLKNSSPAKRGSPARTARSPLKKGAAAHRVAPRTPPKIGRDAWNAEVNPISVNPFEDDLDSDVDKFSLRRTRNVRIDMDDDEPHCTECGQRCQESEKSDSEGACCRKAVQAHSKAMTSRCSTVIGDAKGVPVVVVSPNFGTGDAVADATPVAVNVEKYVRGDATEVKVLVAPVSALEHAAIAEANSAAAAAAAAKPNYSTLLPYDVRTVLKGLALVQVLVAVGGSIAEFGIVMGA